MELLATWLHCALRLSHVEIAERMNVPVSTAKDWVYVGKRKLKARGLPE